VNAPPRIPFIDLRPGEDAGDVRDALDRVVSRGWFVLGPELHAFETEFAAASGARAAAGVGTGTDAIALALRALGVGAGDEVIVPAMTAAYTALAVIAAGARPVIVDVEPDTLTMDPAACLSAVTSRTRAIVPVHLYGQAARMDEIRRVAARHALAIVEDCCQAHLATEGGVPVGTRANAGAFSFYPTKNLGALGDGGAVITNDASLADRVRRLRNGGQAERYRHVETGVNSRLDELQAAVLRARLPHLARWTARRRAIAGVYRRRLPATVRTTAERDGGHVYHLFPIRSDSRDALQAHLKAAGIETLVHYPVPLHEQPALSEYVSAACPEASRAGRELLSLPLHPRLADADATSVADAVGAFQRGRVHA
jgi:dTDP-3-amino-3,4,6-trideoxy-alpha-D-glucose transaminase